MWLWLSVAAIVLIGIGLFLNKFWINAHAASHAAEPPVLVVEPFELEGVTEDMIVHGIPQRIPAKLAVSNDIYPVAQGAVSYVLRYNQSPTSARLLGAQYAVEGSIKQVGDELRVEASLHNVTNHAALWQERFVINDNPEAFNALQDTMILRIAQALGVSLTPAEQQRMSMDISQDEDAITLFLNGERLWAERTKTSLQEAIEMFRMAAQQDSTSPMIRGYLALALDTYVSAEYGDSTYWPQAFAVAQQTLQMDAGSPEALIVMGDHALYVDRDYSAAAAYFDKALESAPGNAGVHQAIAELHLETGDFKTGLKHIFIARKLDPEQKVIRWVETKYLTGIGQLENARSAADELIRMYPDFPYIQNFYWQYYLTKGAYDSAIAAIPQYDSGEDWRRRYALGITYLEEKKYRALHLLYQDNDVPPSLELLEHVQKDEWDQADTLLRTLLAAKNFELLPLAQTSDFEMFNKMKGDQGIQEILSKYGITVNIIPHDHPDI